MTHGSGNFWVWDMQIIENYGNASNGYIWGNIIPTKWYINFQIIHPNKANSDQIDAGTEILIKVLHVLGVDLNLHGCEVTLALAARSTLSKNYNSPQPQSSTSLQYISSSCAKNASIFHIILGHCASVFCIVILP